jgi:hypothetical protein
MGAALAGDGSPESLLVIPLIAGDHRIGVLDVWRYGLDSFSARDLEHCALFAHLTAAAWNNAQLYRELEARVHTDALTGLRNTRWLGETAPTKRRRPGGTVRCRHLRTPALRPTSWAAREIDIRRSAMTSSPEALSRIRLLVTRTYGGVQFAEAC